MMHANFKYTNEGHVRLDFEHVLQPMNVTCTILAV